MMRIIETELIHPMRQIIPEIVYMYWYVHACCLMMYVCLFNSGHLLYELFGIDLRQNIC